MKGAAAAALMQLMLILLACVGQVYQEEVFGPVLVCLEVGEPMP